jgi:AcrR family transcriptional regulator
LVQECDSEKSELILEAAARLLRQKSFKDLSMNELAEEAGVAKGTLYLYFRSKGDIYLSLLLEKLNAFAELVTDVDEQDLTARQALESILDASLRLYTGKTPSTGVPILAIPGIAPEEIEVGLQEHFFPVLEGLKKKLASIFTKGIRSKEFRKLDANRLAGVFLHLMEYCYVHSLLLADKPTNPADEITFMKDIFFRGILV